MSKHFSGSTIHYELVYYYHFHISRVLFSGHRRITNHGSYLSLGKGEESWLSRDSKGCSTGPITSLFPGNSQSCIDQHGFQEKFRISVHYTEWIEMINPGSRIQEESIWCCVDPKKQTWKICSLSCSAASEAVGKWVSWVFHHQPRSFGKFRVTFFTPTPKQRRHETYLCIFV